MEDERFNCNDIMYLQISLALLEYAAILFRMRFISKQEMIIITPEQSGNLQSRYILKSEYSHNSVGIDLSYFIIYLLENVPMVQTVTSQNRCLKKRNGRRNSNSVQQSHPDYNSDIIQGNQSLTIDRVALFIMPLLYVCISLLYWITYLR